MIQINGSPGHAEDAANDRLVLQARCTNCRNAKPKWGCAAKRGADGNGGEIEGSFACSHVYLPRAYLPRAYLPRAGLRASWVYCRDLHVCMRVDRWSPVL